MPPLPEAHAKTTYAAIDRFVVAALKKRDSMFTPGSAIWSSDTLEDLHRRFVLHPDLSKTTFTAKFQRQLAGAPRTTLQLAAEVLFVQLLTPFRISAKTKQTLVDGVITQCKPPIPFPEDLRRAFDRGFVSDQSFNQHRPFHLQFIIEFVRKWWTVTDAARDHMLEDPWAFKDFALTVNVKASQPMREILYFFVHRNSFEPITSRKHKRLICAKFRDRVTDPQADPDRLLLQIRTALSPEYGRAFHFYEPGIRPLWQGGEVDDSDEPWEVFMEWARRIRETESFERDEVEYKQRIAENTALARRTLFAGDSSFTQTLRRAFGPPNNLTAWQLHDKYLDWCESRSSEALPSLRLLWSEGDIEQRMRGFLAALPSEVVKGSGVRATLLSFLLMAIDPKVYPIYRKSPFKAAYKLSGHRGLAPRPDGVEQYAFALDFLDKMIKASQADEVPIANRMEAQGVVWAMTQWPSRPSDWSEEEWSEFERFRKGGGPTIPDIDTSDETHDDPADSPSLTELAESLFLDEEFLADVVRLLEDKRQVVFFGPPGTGKTFIAQKIAEYLAGAPDRVRLVQFHPSYTYEDFIEGYRPGLVEGQPGFRLIQGPLKAIAEQAAAHRDQQFILVIDEINRGNLAKVFGELYFLLEYRKHAIRLQYSDTEFRLPENLWIIATMNTADRSIALIDSALRRRFYFIEFSPDRPPIEGLLRRWLRNRQPDKEWIADLVDHANKQLDNRHIAIGPSHFMKERLTDEWVEMIWRHAIVPYIEEQFFGEPDRIDEFELDRLKPIVMKGQHASAPGEPTNAPPDAD